ncbi:MAG: SPFH domain-containing protein [Actinobacteria bacterium]|nr:SPFH domain-containing protein [Actinomycetota bacterium]
MLAVVITLYVLSPVLIALTFVWGTTGADGEVQPVWSLFVTGLVVLGAAILLSPGFFTIQPNEARVLILFGDYKGTCRQVGFRWGNPFYANGPASQAGGSSTQWNWSKKASDESQVQAGPKKLRRYKVSLRARTLNGDRLKVNDKRGNPVDIAAVVVWRVEDTAKAVFDVDDFESYVAMQSETAVRHLASAYPYDSGETSADSDDEITLRGNVDQVSEALRVELAERLGQAGVVVEQARLSHLAYSPEIAQAMLRRQQAEAIIAARRKIVTGAVSMVEMALEDFKEHQTIEFDEERKAAMVSNLMVVLCGESQVTPVVNTGTLYQ